MEVDAAASIVEGFVLGHEEVITALRRDDPVIALGVRDIQNNKKTPNGTRTKMAQKKREAREGKDKHEKMVCGGKEREHASLSSLALL